METSCPFNAIFDFWPCFDFWINRYQTLIVGLIASVLVAQQIKISKDQEKIMAQQHAQTKALATLKVDEALRVLSAPHHLILECGLQNPDLWGVNSAGVFRFTLPYSVEDLSSASAVAFPERITELAQLFRIASELDAVYEDHIDDPWYPVGLMKNMVDLPDDEATRHRVRGERGAQVVRVFMEAYGKIADLMPDVRKAA